MKNKKLTYTVDEAKKKMEYYCSYQERCYQEVDKKLREMNMITEARDVIVLHLMGNDYVNEERFAKSFAGGKFRIKKWGKQRITRALKLKDISEYNINSALKEIDYSDYRNTIYELSKRKYETLVEKDYYKKRKKMFDYLMYRGYEVNLINETLNEIFNDENEFHKN